MSHDDALRAMRASLQDLQQNRTPIGTFCPAWRAQSALLAALPPALVERSTGYTLLVPLNDGFKAEQVAPALAAKIQTLPAQLRRSMTWDQGVEMRDWKQVQVAADIDIFFCDPKSPWQRATNENTNGLLRQYFPKGTDLSVHTEAHLDAVADELNDRPRKRLEFNKPIEMIGPLLLR